ncbi:DUF397 domain-containing protein [Streptomyces sp. NPDC058686]|uniref:DUF397 domain-containing protein n=1 Tax=Streptomyces sp. NPDC058686 TaxID=3346599 RepID=UPI003666C52B
MTEGPNWRTSNYTQHENCVEVADNDPSVVMVRDSKGRWRGKMTVRPVTWAAFVEFSKVVKL